MILSPTALLYSGMAVFVACFLSFGGGFWLATSQTENKLITAASEAYDRGTAAQQAFDAGNRKKAQADFLKRQAADKVRDDKLAALEQDVHPTDPMVAPLVPHVEACTVSADAMKRLNEVVGP